MIFGGQSSEHDVSCVSAANVIDGLREDKYDIYRIGITKEGKWLFVEDTDSIRDGSWVEGTVTAVISPDHGKKGIWKVTGNDVEVIPIDVAFPVLHGKERPGSLIGIHPCLALRSAPWQPDTTVIELSDRVVKLCGVQRVPDVGYRDGKRVRFQQRFLLTALASVRQLMWQILQEI